jgi:hypothetical protein
VDLVDIKHAIEELPKDERMALASWLAERDQIALTPKSLVDHEIAEGLGDVKEGRTYGPYGTADEMIGALHALARKTRSSAAKKRR